MKEILKLHSSVSPLLIRHAILRGMGIAFIGIAILLYAGIFFDLAILKNWGFLIFFASMTLIIKGLLPYRHLARLLSNPNTLILAQELRYFSKNTGTLNIPIEAIQDIFYFNTPELYGIGIRLNPRYKDLTFEASAFMYESAQRFQVDLFFPYFSKRSYEELNHYLKR